LGSNLSIVQIPQDFSRTWINVLPDRLVQLTLDDTNEEAAKQPGAVQPPQSITHVSPPLAPLANTSACRGVLQLLR